MLRVFIVALFYLLHVTSGKNVLRTGEIVEKDPTDAKYKKLAEESMKKYLHDAHIKSRYFVSSVYFASEQVVSGFLTRIDFTIKMMYERSHNEMDCHSEILTAPWLGPNKIDVHCHRANELIGGIVVKNPKDPKYKKLAEEAMKKYVKDTHTKIPYIIESVLRVTEQIVEGNMIRITFTIRPNVDQIGGTLKCYSKIWERKWLGPNQIKVNCAGLNPFGRTEKREGFGVIVVKNPKDPKYKKLAEEAMKKYVKDTHKKVPYHVVSVLHATEQVVEGFLIRIDFTIRPDLKQIGGTLKCHSEILEREWLGPNQIEVSCAGFHPVVRTEGRGIPGGIVAKNPKDPKYKELAEESMEKYLKDTNKKVPYHVVSVLHASEQVVAGFKIRIDFTIIPDLQQIGGLLKCHAEIWERPWLGPNQIQVNCAEFHPVVRTEGREGLGGIVVKNPKDPKYKELAEESMEKYLKDMLIEIPYKVLVIKHVSEQIVAGLIVRINFDIVPVLPNWTGFPRQCHSEIWEKPWENFKNINVGCIEPPMGGF